MQQEINTEAGAAKTAQKVFLAYFNENERRAEIIPAEIQEDHGGYYTISGHGIWTAAQVFFTEVAARAYLAMMIRDHIAGIEIELDTFQNLLLAI